uniref:Uncharacterized protein n=1 Tax=Oryza punctata TaxID=4537 RepID=A0A0E0K8G5_ORYPU
MDRSRYPYSSKDLWYSLKEVGAQGGKTIGKDPTVVEALRNECKKGITCMLEEILAGQAEEIGEKVTWVTEQPLMDILATWHLLCNVKY